VDGAIHRAAGPELLEACARLGGCPAGDAKLTPAFGRLQEHGVRFVIHAVGPVWRRGASREAELLRGCYEAAMRLAAAHGARSIAFPAISTGAYGYPVAAAARIAVDAVRRAVREPGPVASVRFVCFSAAALEVYRRLLEA
jgi:O-acetyl-ADP-ribose deacetylase (regulator of RNase III)